MHLSPLATTPVQAYEKAGLDIFPASIITINTGEQASVPTDLVICPPDRTYASIASHSRITRETGIHIIAGIIDPDFQGNIHVLLLNHSTQPFTTS
eukprot:960366-Rhodomonas_salina.1